MKNVGSIELEEILELVAESWERFPYPTFPCPANVLVVIIRINHLRSALLKPGTDVNITPEDLLNMLDSFSPESWSAAMPSFHEQWLAIATAYQSAAVIYCVSALEPYFSASSRQDIEVKRAIDSARLLSTLQRFEEPVVMRYSLIWPLLVAGVEAAREGAAAREFVRKRFTTLARDLSTPLMLETKRVLERFWTSGRVKWEQCFDRPYAFVI